MILLFGGALGSGGLLLGHPLGELVRGDGGLGRLVGRVRVGRIGLEGRVENRLVVFEREIETTGRGEESSERTGASRCRRAR